MTLPNLRSKLLSTVSLMNACLHMFDPYQQVGFKRVYSVVARNLAEITG